MKQRARNKTIAPTRAKQRHVARLAAASQHNAARVAEAAGPRGDAIPAAVEEYCVDCCRDIGPGDTGHENCQRIAKRPLLPDTLGAESVDATEIEDNGDIERIPTGTPGLDKVLNGGLPKQGVVLIDGEPGIGKSTLFVKTAGSLASRGYNVLYVSGEETNGQVAVLARRLGVIHEGLRFFHCDHMERILREIRVLKTKGIIIHVVVCDSVQTIRSDTIGGDAGSVSQVRKVGEMLRLLAKEDGGPAVLETCHVTKDGEMAGPKTLEHTCDAHLTFGRGRGEERFIRGVKYRFGPTGVIAPFQMTPAGLVDAVDPTFTLWTELLSDAGVAGFVSAHAAQPIIVPVECQIYDPGEGVEGRGTLSSSGFARDRLQFLLDAMSMHCAMQWGKRSIRVRVPEVGGNIVSDPAIDLAVVAALWSAFHRKPLQPLLYWGEIGLSGRITAGERPEQRLRLAASIRGPLRGVMVGDRSGLTSGQLRVNAVRHLSDVVSMLEKAATPVALPLAV